MKGAEGDTLKLPASLMDGGFLLSGLLEQAHQLRVFRDDFGVARFCPDVARPFFVARFVALRVELLADFVTAFRFGVDFLAAALAGTRFFAGGVFAFVLDLVG